MRRTGYLVAVGVVLLTMAAACSSSDPAVDTGSSAPSGTAPGTSSAGGAGTGGSGATTTAPTPSTLAGQTFVSTSVTGQELVAGTRITITFTESTFSASAGCNTLGGSYALEGSALTVDDDVASTLMGCPEPLSAQDAWLGGWLTGGLVLTATDEGIALTGSGVTVDLAAETAPGGGTGAASLVGPTWTLTSLVAGDAVSSLPAGVEAPTLVFADDGTVAVFTGCNRGSTTAEVGDDGFLTFGPLMLTKMACGPDAQALETAITAVLTGRVAYGFDGSDLSISTRDQGLLYSPG